MENSKYITALEKARNQKDDNIISKKWKLLDKETTLMKRKKEEELSELMSWTKILKRYTRKTILTSSQKQIPSENSLGQTENFKRPKQSWKGLN